MIAAHDRMGPEAAVGEHAVEAGRDAQRDGQVQPDQQGEVAPGDRPLPELHDRDARREERGDHDDQDGRLAGGLAEPRSVEGEKARGRVHRTLHCKPREFLLFDP